jgi:outer membrane lipoprotein LolB
VKWCVFGLCALLLAGCATRPVLPPDQQTLIRARARDDHGAAFSLSARFVVKGPDQTASASLDWQHSSESDELQINGPLGKVLALLNRDAGGVRLTDDRQRVTQAATLDELAYAAFGADIPLNGAAYWVTGRAGRALVMSRDVAGRLSVLSERGWRIEFVEYEDDSAEALPRLIEASDGEHSFRLLVDAWNPVP